MRIAVIVLVVAIVWPCAAIAQNADLCETIVERAFDLLELTGEEWSDTSGSLEDRLFSVTEVDRVFDSSRNKRREYFLDYADGDTSLGVDLGRSESIATSARDHYYSLRDEQSRKEYASFYFRTLFNPWAPDIIQIIDNCMGENRDYRGLVLGVESASSDQDRTFFISLQSRTDRGHNYTLVRNLDVIGAECVSNNGVTVFKEGFVLRGGDSHREVWRLVGGHSTAHVGVETQEGGPLSASYFGELGQAQLGGSLGVLLDQHVRKLDDARLEFYTKSWRFWLVLMQADWSTTYEVQAQSLKREIREMGSSVRGYIDAVDDLLVLLKVVETQSLVIEELVEVRDWLLQLSRMVDHCEDWILLSEEPGDDTKRNMPIVFVRRVDVPSLPHGEIGFGKSGRWDVYQIAMSRRIASVSLGDINKIVPYDEKVRVVVKTLEQRLGAR